MMIIEYRGYLGSPYGQATYFDIDGVPFRLETLDRGDRFEYTEMVALTGGGREIKNEFHWTESKNRNDAIDEVLAEIGIDRFCIIRARKRCKTETCLNGLKDIAARMNKRVDRMVRG